MVNLQPQVGLTLAEQQEDDLKEVGAWTMLRSPGTGTPSGKIRILLSWDAQVKELEERGGDAEKPAWDGGE